MEEGENELFSSAIPFLTFSAVQFSFFYELTRTKNLSPAKYDDCWKSFLWFCSRS